MLGLPRRSVLGDSSDGQGKGPGKIQNRAWTRTTAQGSGQLLQYIEVLRGLQRQCRLALGIFS